MKILLAATNTCQHRPLLEHALQIAWLPYKVIYFEDHPEILKKYQLQHSPLLIVNEKVKSGGMPGTDKINELIIRNKEISEIRFPKRAKKHKISNNINTAPGLVEVDTTWGSIQPIQSARDVLTVGELEIFHNKKNDLLIIDTRKGDTIEEVNIPGAKNIPYD
jgi:hypothetical protein